MEQTTDIAPLATNHLAADWLRRNGIDVSPLGERVAAVLAVVYSGIYNAPASSRTFRRPTTRRGHGWADAVFVEVLIDRSLHSWDDNSLTRLVVACHDAALRVQIAPHTFRHLRLGFSARDREGSLSQGCPTMDEAVRIVRTHYQTPSHATLKPSDVLHADN